MVRLAVALFAVQAGFIGFIASLPVALARAGVPEPQIGLVVGTAALVQLPAALVAGVVVDWFGALRVFVAGALAFLIGCTVLLLPGVEPGGPSWPLIVARVFQGIGVASTLPAALSLVPRLTSPVRLGFGLAFIGSAHNLTLVVFPPLSLMVLGASSLKGVAFFVIGFVVAGLILVWVAPFQSRPYVGGSQSSEGPAMIARRTFGLAFRRSWAPLITIIVVYAAHWGVVVAYLPQRAEAAGADIGLLFAFDGIAILIARMPSGWLVDRVRPIVLMAAGLLATTVAILLLTLPLTTPLLIVAGLLTGAGAAPIMTSILVELSRRSDDADRGSAFALFSAALAGAMVVGSIGGAPLISAYGFRETLLVTLAGMIVAAILTVTDLGLRRRPPAGRPTPLATPGH